MPTDIPLSLYIHMPWCVQKCLYCDFNSHTLYGALPEEQYIDHLCQELECKIHHCCIPESSIVHSIFIGGGTPSLFSGYAYQRLFACIQKYFELSQHIEITLEANPGTTDQKNFLAYRDLPINRISLGVQSMHQKHLVGLGRAHDVEQARVAMMELHSAGFGNFNVDLMFGLPKQSIQEALEDLSRVLEHKPSHLSWYQLTIEPHTPFFHQKPQLPEDEMIWEMQQQGCALLKAHGYEHYEISAFAQPKRQSQHNLNYWLYGDYLGIGAGAHSKITRADGLIERHWNIKHPKHYLQASQKIAQQHAVTLQERPFEFMMNALRLYRSTSYDLFRNRTDLDPCIINDTVSAACHRGLLEADALCFQPTELGYRFLNDLLELFLPIIP